MRPNAATCASFLVLVALVGCADGAMSSSQTAAAVETVPAAPASDAGAPAATLAREVHWTRNSAEHAALVRQTYRLATQMVDVRETARASKGPWGVVLDVDETTLDNSTYQKERGGLPYSAETWTAWVARKEAEPLPGAREFLEHVRARGGKIVLVTNRADATECAPTEENLKAKDVPYDAILCKKETSDKNPRFQAVTDGTAVSGLSALDVLVYVGDNILDFPGQSQAIRLGPEDKFADFGSRFIVLPNPMYGSWEANPKD